MDKNDFKYFGFNIFSAKALISMMVYYKMHEHRYPSSPEDYQSFVYEQSKLGETLKVEKVVPAESKTSAIKDQDTIVALKEVKIQILKTFSGA